ncbi:hypothetical protein CC85DRAFT_128232 [Cutaneotrichosporon oleaginosum]|uniref:Uncharacterized protein n=1 Tax=Cutaneotrichosporon oleaginosum TaxID=879819 RepID=A0A0J0XJE2_9TREE|nr:uncharacterized protein CC85DRAFT_128232 [Cutaneotrichosporon oleaginosum]KLT41198.1 hypothetical protein CC85DRAFT_128232 [Cutaneotrichosporon oleaginosum]TXT14085.1 hypothetical protein COLE_00278 [Cutaneotrichosporon oleaginosum]
MVGVGRQRQHAHCESKAEDVGWRKVEGGSGRSNLTWTLCAIQFVTVVVLRLFDDDADDHDTNARASPRAHALEAGGLAWSRGKDGMDEGWGEGVQGKWRAAMTRAMVLQVVRVDDGQVVVGRSALAVFASLATTIAMVVVGATHCFLEERERVGVKRESGSHADFTVRWHWSSPLQQTLNCLCLLKAQSRRYGVMTCGGVYNAARGPLCGSLTSACSPYGVIWRNVYPIPSR